MQQNKHLVANCQNNWIYLAIRSIFNQLTWRNFLLSFSKWNMFTWLVSIELEKKVGRLLPQLFKKKLKKSQSFDWKNWISNVAKLILQQSGCLKKLWDNLIIHLNCRQTRKFVPAAVNDNTNCLLMACPFTGPKMFCAGSNVLSYSKNLIAFRASPKTFVPAKKPILMHANHLLVWHKMFVTGTICIWIFGLT